MLRQIDGLLVGYFGQSDIEIINNKIIIVASSWLFILLYQWCTVTLTSDRYSLVYIVRRLFQEN